MYKGAAETEENKVPEDGFKMGGDRDILSINILNNREMFINPIALLWGIS